MSLFIDKTCTTCGVFETMLYGGSILHTLAVILTLFCSLISSSKALKPIMTTTTTTTTTNKKITQITTPQRNDKYIIRPYESSRDESSMKKICRDVWNGTDYLPSKAIEFEQDTSCDFVVMVNEDSEVVALGNRRIICQHYSDDDDSPNDISWIEAIRTSTKHKGKGIATALTKGLMARSIDDGITHIMSCTVDGNIAMKKIFERVELKKINEMQRMDFGMMVTLPGWSSKNNDNDRKAESILKALNVENLVDDESRSTKWTTVKDETELKDLLEEMKNQGGLGYLPDIGKPHFFGTQQMRNCLAKGLIRKKLNTINDAYDEESKPCVYGLIENTAIQSLKSKWVCCIAGLDSSSVGAALWDACSDEMVKCRGGEVAFATMFDGIMLPSTDIQPSNDLIAKLHIQTENVFNLYSSK